MHDFGMSCKILQDLGKILQKIFCWGPMFNTLKAIGSQYINTAHHLVNQAQVVYHLVYSCIIILSWHCRHVENSTVLQMIYVTGQCSLAVKYSSAFLI